MKILFFFKLLLGTCLCFNKINYLKMCNSKFVKNEIRLDIKHRSKKFNKIIFIFLMGME